MADPAAQLARIQQLRDQAEANGDAVALEQAIALARKTLGSPLDGGLRASLLYSLSDALEFKHLVTGDARTLREGVDAAAAAVRATSANDPDLPFYCLQGIRLLEVKYATDRQAGDVELACELLAAALGAQVVDEDELAQALTGVHWIWFRRRFEATNRIQHADAAVAAARALLDLRPADIDRTEVLMVLGAMIQVRYERTGSTSDLLEATAIADRVLAELPPEADIGPAALSELACAHRLRFLGSGDLRDLNEAVDKLRRAVDTAPPSDDFRFGILANLATTVLHRHEETGAFADVIQAYSAASEAAALGREQGLEEHPALLTTLAAVADALTERTGDPRYLSEALRVAEHAAHRLRGMRYQTEALTTLGFVLMSAGRSADPGRRRAALRRWFDRRRPSLLTRSVQAFQDAAESIPPDHPGRGVAFANLSQSLIVRGTVEGRAGDVDQAVRHGREALRIGAATIRDHAHVRSILGQALLLRHAVSGRQEDGIEACECFRQATGAIGAPSSVRLGAARDWAAATIEAGLDREATVAAYTAAVDLLPLLAFRGAGREDNEWRLRQETGLATDAAASAVLADRPDTALTMLERGRTVLWNSLLASRPDLNRLAEANAALAERLRVVGRALERQDGPGTSVTRRYA